METWRLKNITILILLLLNAFLLSLLLHFRLQQAGSREQLREELRTLYAGSALALPEEDQVLSATAPAALSLERDLDYEARLAAYLLGEEAEGEHQGGGIYTYHARTGTVQFRSNGAFDYLPASRVVTSPAEFCRELCQTFGYEETESTLGTTASGSFSALRSVSGVAVHNASLSVLFEGGRLVSLTGSCLSLKDSAALPSSRFTAVDALVKFLDFRNGSGVVCSAVADVQPVYELQVTGAQPLGLAVKWQIVTDTYLYYVDCATGEVSRG